MPIAIWLRRQNISSERQAQILSRDAAQHMQASTNFSGRCLDPTIRNVSNTDAIEIPSFQTVNSKDALIHHVYEGLELNFNNGPWMSLRAILTTKNNEVDKLNDDLMNKLTGNMIILKSVDLVADDDQAALYPSEFLNSLSISGLPPHIIKLKIGAPIMFFFRNLDHRNGHRNVTRYTVLSASPTLITATKLTGVNAGRVLLTPTTYQLAAVRHRITIQPVNTSISSDGCFCNDNQQKSGAEFNKMWNLTPYSMQCSLIDN